MRSMHRPSAGLRSEFRKLCLIGARVRSEVDAKVTKDLLMREVVTKGDLALAFENLMMRLTIRIGVMLATSAPLTSAATLTTINLCNTNP